MTAIETTNPRSPSPILDLLPEAREAMKYSRPTILYHDSLVHYAAFKHNLGPHQTPPGVEAGA